LILAIVSTSWKGTASIAAAAPLGDAHIQTVKMGQMSQGTGKRLNGAAAAILAVPFPRVDTNAYIKGG